MVADEFERQNTQFSMVTAVFAHLNINNFNPYTSMLPSFGATTPFYLAAKQDAKRGKTIIVLLIF
jgi:hypothetical protein